jgi:hypothetical protein
MLASVPLLDMAAEYADGELRRYYLQHAQEESGHVEMLLSDLHALGVDDVPRYHLAAQLTGSQYYLIKHEHPALLLGYMHAMESNAPTVETVDKLEAECGVPLTCMRHHAIHDPGHTKDLEAQIRLQPAEIQSLIAWNESNCADMLIFFFKSH